MDRSQSWRVTRQYAKTAAAWTADRGRWSAEKWRAESRRRTELRIETAPRLDAARWALAAARQKDPHSVEARRAEIEVARARRAMPSPLWLVAAKGVGIAAVAGVGLPNVPDQVIWLWSAISVATAAVGAVIWLLTRRPKSALTPTAEESALLGRLAPEHWAACAERRGLGGTVTGRPELTDAGITCAVRLDGTWTVSKLRGAEDHIRSLLGCRTSVRVEVKASGRGGWATLTVRTRSAADGIELTGWTPGAPWGIDTITGEPVMVPLGRRMLIAGTSGAGKSWSTRALLAEASEYDDHRLAIFDRKRVEVLNWRHRARGAVEPDEMLMLSDELVAEMDERLQLIPRGHDVIQITSERPRITVFVDEGGEAITVAASDRKTYGRIIENLRSIARMGRAAEIIVIWATQKPTMSGEGHGIDSQIAGQITYRASLALSSAGESQTVFGSDAHEKGWHAHELPMPGVALLRSSPKAKPHPIKTRAFSPADVIALPDRPVWHRAAAPVAAQPTEARPALRLVKEDDFLLAPPGPVPAVEIPAARTSESAVLEAVRKAPGPVRQKDIVTSTGLPKGTVSKVVRRLADTGRLVRRDDGTISVGGAEVTA